MDWRPFGQVSRRRSAGRRYIARVTCAVSHCDARSWHLDINPHLGASKPTSGVVVRQVVLSRPAPDPATGSASREYAVICCALFELPLLCLAPLLLLQAKVFQLARDDGTPIGKVIKINHADIGSKILNNNVLWIGMDREWEIGTQVRPWQLAGSAMLLRCITAWYLGIGAAGTVQVAGCEARKACSGRSLSPRLLACLLACLLAAACCPASARRRGPGLYESVRLLGGAEGQPGSLQRHADGRAAWCDWGAYIGMPCI